MGLWLYLSGVLGSLLCSMYIGYVDWKEGNDITLSDVFVHIIFALLSWFAFLYLIINIFSYNIDIIIIKGKKNNNIQWENCWKN